MHEWTSAAPPLVAAFMASLVEFVEALTVVLAVGVVRGWRSALTGTAGALAVLVALVATLGPALTRIPLQVVQLAVGTLLVLFGLRWLRKAVLRSAGVIALSNEAEAFEEEVAAMRRLRPASTKRFDAVAFTSAFKIVMLEGIEVVFIVIAIGAGGTMLVPACLGAALALVAVVALGFWLHRPLARVPENTLKFAVGVLLSAFGCFWVGEGIGLAWPGADLALVALVIGFLILSLGLVRTSRKTAAAHAGQPAPPRVAEPARRRGALTAAANELLGLFVDDGWLAIGAVAWIAVAGVAERQALHALPIAAAGLLAAGFAVVLGASVLRRARG